MAAAKKINDRFNVLQQLLSNSATSSIILSPIHHNSQKTDKNAKVIGICDDRDPLELLEFYAKTGIGHIVQESGINPENEVKQSENMLNDPGGFLKAPISSMLSPFKVNQRSEQELMSFSCEFRNSNEKTNILTELEAQLEKLTKSRSLISDIRVASDELITNAIYNAGFVDRDNVGPGANRTHLNVEIPENKTARFFMGSDGEQVVIGCHDIFGKLNLDKLVARISQCYRTGVGNNINMGAGGAGIGSFLVYHLCTSYYVAVEANKNTMVCCSFPLKMSGTKRSLTPKSIHLFKINEEEK